MTRSRKIALALMLIPLAAGIAAGVYCLNHSAAIPAQRSWVYAWRVGIVAMSLAAWFITQSLIGSAGLGLSGIGDAVHNLTAPLNRYLLAHPPAANALLILSSALIDLLGLFLIAFSILAPPCAPSQP